MKASDLFVKALENEGVEYIFGVPGEENLDLLDSLRESRIKLVVTRHEQAAGFMAATYGRLTGKAGVALSTLGPGATNFTTAAAYAQLGAMPLVLITGQKPIKQSKQGEFQIINTINVLDPLTKFTKQIVSGASIPVLIRKAFRYAENERPGTVHLELPEDIASEDTTEVTTYAAGLPRRPVAEEKAIQQAIAKIEQAHHPLILIGAGANRKRTSKMLREFVDKTRIPFFSTQMGKGVVDETSTLYMGTAALSENDYLHCAIERADLIINFGHDIVEKPPFIIRNNKLQVIHVNFFPAPIDTIYVPQLEVIGDIANAVWQIKEGITRQEHWDFSYYKRVKQRMDEHITRDIADDRYPIIPQAFVALVRKLLSEDNIVVLDNGMYKIWFARNYRAHRPNTLLLDNALATMGAGLPSAMAAKLINPDKPVLAVVGDGGFMMNSQELETAVRLGLNLTIVILRDNAYGMIKWKQEAMGFARFGLDFDNPNFVKYAESFGANGYRPDSVLSLRKTLEKTLKRKGIHIIDVAIDYSENKRVLVDELREKTCDL